jgi:hypothetical protein
MSMFGAVGESTAGFVNKVGAKATVWTTVWPLWECYEGNCHPHEDNPSAAVPIVWLRHDRSLGLIRGAACVFCNEVEMKPNAGSTPEPEEGMKEQISFSIYGRQATVTITTVKTGTLQAFLAMNYTYTLHIDGVLVANDTQSDPPRAIAALGSSDYQTTARVEVRGFRVVAARGKDWTSDMVTEYGVCTARDGFAACSSGSGAPPPPRLMRWVRFSEVDQLHQQLYSCFPSSEAKALPKLPSKTWRPKGSSSNSDAFAKGRATALQQYLRAVMAMPRGPRLPYLRRFLGLSDVVAEPLREPLQLHVSSPCRSVCHVPPPPPLR